MLFILFIFLTSFSHLSFAIQPGLRIGASEKALQKAINYFLPQLVAAAKTVVIPGESTKHYSYDDIHISSFSIASAVASTPNNTLILRLNKISVSVPSTTFHVYDKILGIKISCHGELTASITNTNMSFSLKILDKNGKADIQAVVTSVQFGSVHVSHKFHSVCKIVDDIVEIFIGDVNKKLEEAIKKDVPDAIQKELNKVAVEIMAEFTTIIKIDKYSELDYSLVTNMITPKNVLTFNVKGEFKSVVTPKESSLVASAMPPPVVKSDVCVQINQYVLNTATEVYTNAGVFAGSENYSTTAKLNTSIPLIGPAMYKLCPNCNVVARWGILGKAQGGIIPVFNIKNGSIYLTLVASLLDIDLVNATYKKNNVLDTMVNITASASVSVNVSNPAIFLKIALEHFEFEVKSSLLPGPPIDLKHISVLIQSLLQVFVVPLINSKLPVIPIPRIKEISFVNPSITENTQAITVQTDIKFH